MAVSQAALKQPARQVQSSSSGVAPLHVSRHTLSGESPQALIDATVSGPHAPFSQSVQLDDATPGCA
jgi:hypothetical protein